MYNWINQTNVLDSYRSFQQFQKINFWANDSSLAAHIFMTSPRPYFNWHVSAVKNRSQTCTLLFNDFNYEIKLLFWHNDIEWKMHFTIREKIMKQLFSIHHNHKHILSKSKNGLLTSAHANVELYSFGYKTQYFGAYLFSVKHK